MLHAAQRLQLRVTLVPVESRLREVTIIFPFQLFRTVLHSRLIVYCLFAAAAAQKIVTDREEKWRKVKELGKDLPHPLPSPLRFHTKSGKKSLFVLPKRYTFFRFCVHEV